MLQCWMHCIWLPNLAEKQWTRMMSYMALPGYLEGIGLKVGDKGKSLAAIPFGCVIRYMYPVFPLFNTPLQINAISSMAH